MSDDNTTNPTPKVNTRKPKAAQPEAKKEREIVVTDLGDATVDTNRPLVPNAKRRLSPMTDLKDEAPEVLAAYSKASGFYREGDLVVVES